MSNTERDELALVVEDAANTVTCLDIDESRMIAEAIHAAGYRKPRTVTTAAELNALRHGSVLLTSDYTDTALLKDGDVFRNQSGADVTTEILISYGTQPFTVLYEPTA